MEAWINLICRRVNTCMLAECTLYIEWHFFRACSYTWSASSKQAIRNLSIINLNFLRRLCFALRYDYLREWLWLEGHWPTAWGNLCIWHRNVLEARRDVITIADWVRCHVIALAIWTLPRLRLLSQHRGCDQGLLWRSFIIQCLLFVHFVDIIRLSYQTIILIVFHDHAPYCNKEKIFMLRSSIIVWWRCAS